MRTDQWSAEKIAQARKLRAAKTSWRRIAELFCCAESTLFEALARDDRAKRRELHEAQRELRIAQETARTGIPPYRAKYHLTGTYGRNEIFGFDEDFNVSKRHTK